MKKINIKKNGQTINKVSYTDYVQASCSYTSGGVTEEPENGIFTHEYTGIGIILIDGEYTRVRAIYTTTDDRFDDSPGNPEWAEIIDHFELMDGEPETGWDIPLDPEEIKSGKMKTSTLKDKILQCMKADRGHVDDNFVHYIEQINGLISYYVSAVELSAAKYWTLRKNSLLAERR